MICINCNKNFDDELEFCPHCGAENDKIKYCPKCETSYFNADYCECGGKLLTRGEYVSNLKNNLLCFYESHSWVLDENGQSEIFYRMFEFDEEVLKKLIKLDKTTGKYWIFALYLLLLGKDNEDENLSNQTSSNIYKKELSYLDNAKKLNPKSIFYWYGKIELLLRCELYEKVLDIIDMEIDKTDNDSLNNLFKDYEPKIYDSLPNISAKWKTIFSNETHNIFPTSLKFKPLYLIKAECLEKLEQYEEAIELYEKYGYFAQKGGLLEKLGKFEEALENYEKSLELEEGKAIKCPKCEKNYIELYPGSGVVYPDSGVSYDENFCHHCDVVVDDVSNYFFEESINNIENKQFNDIEWWDSLIKFKPSSSAYFHKAISLKAMGKYGEAIKSCNNSIELGDNEYHSWLVKAECYDKLENHKKEIMCYKKAMECCNRLINMNNKCFSGWDYKAECLKQLEKYEEAIKCYNEMIKIASTSFEKEISLLAKIECLEKMGRIEEGLSIFNKLIEESDDEDYLEYKYEFLERNNLLLFKKFEKFVQEKNYDSEGSGLEDENNKHKYWEDYLLSSNFENLCEALDFLPEDVKEIKQKVSVLEDKSNIEESITLILYNQLQKYKKPPSNEIYGKHVFYGKISDDLETENKYFYQVYIRDKNKWDDIKNKLEVGVESGKINTEYLFEKEFYHELDSISNSEYHNALICIYLHEINFLLKSYYLSHGEKNFIFKDACLGFHANPLFFDKIKQEVDETVGIIKTMPRIEIKEFNNDDLWVSYMIVEDKKTVPFIDDFFMKNDEMYNEDLSDCLFTYPSFLGIEMVFFVITCGDIDTGFKHRTDFSNVFIIKKELIENSEGLLISQRSDLAKHFETYINDDFREHGLQLEECKTEEYKQLGFKQTTYENPNDGTIWHILDVLDSGDCKKEYNPEDLYDIVSQNPLSKEFLGILSSLNFDIDYGYEIQKASKDREEVLYMLNRKILADKNYTRDRVSKEELLIQLDEYHKKFILKSIEDSWDEIKEEFTSKINSNQIKSSYDLQFELGQRINSNFKLNILNAQIEALINFRELDDSYSEELAYYLRDKDILNNGLAEYLNELTKSKEIELPKIKQKKYPDDGKFAAPRWLVFPYLARGSMGWRMGWGETYNLNEPWHTEEFEKFFPKPQNWLFNLSDVDYDSFPILGIFWTKNGMPKYSEISDDSVEVNDFITIEQKDSEFKYNAKKFLSIEHAILTSKYDLFDKIDYYNTSFNTLKRGFELTKDEKEYWQNFKYSVCLNASYYKFMQDENLKQKLLDTGEKSLVYISDDEWGGHENLFGFALMELRDEIRRLYKNEDRIDWEYTEYLKHKDPYETDVEERNLKFVRSIFE